MHTEAAGRSDVGWQDRARLSTAKGKNHVHSSGKWVGRLRPSFFRRLRNVLGFMPS
jgi:hypothetical protein